MNKCERCKKEFKRRYEYERHLDRIFPCKDNNTHLFKRIKLYTFV